MKYPDKVVDICQMLDDKKAEDIVICSNNRRNVVDYYIVSTLSSSAHIKGVSDYIIAECAKLPLVYGNISVEGFSTSSWLVMDFGDIFLHLFTKEERQHYNFDKFINDDGNVITFKKLLQIIEQNKKKQLSQQKHEEKAKLKAKLKSQNKSNKKMANNLVESQKEGND